MEKIKLDGRLGFSLEVTPEELKVLTGEDRDVAKEFLVNLVQSENCHIVGDTYFPVEWNEEVLNYEMEDKLSFDLPVISLSADSEDKHHLHGYALEEEAEVMDEIKDVEKYRTEYLDFLKEQLKDKCNSDMCCEVYWDYRDEISPSTLREVVDDYREKGFDTPKNFLFDKLLDLNFDYDDDMFREIETEIENCDNKHVTEYFEQYGDLREDAFAVGYNGVDVKVDEILSRSEFHINVMFATDEERNYDMGSIVSAYGSYREPDLEYLNDNIDILDNALTYFIHQQGHSVKEVYDCLFRNPRGWVSGADLSFAEAIVNDIVNNSSEAMSELTALVKLDGNEFLEFFEAVKKGDKYLTFGKDTEIGLFNEWAGTGGLLEFKLDKPFVVPTTMVREVQIEGARNTNYSVDSVYGLIGSCWKETLGYTDEKPMLFEEDLASNVKAVRSYLYPFELKKYGRDDEIIATIHNNTGSVLKFSFDEKQGLDSIEIAPNGRIDLFYDESGLEALDAIEDEEYKLDIVDLKPQLDDVIKSCSEKVDQAPVLNEKNIVKDRE